MKIRVVSVKGLSSYFSKIIILLAIMFVFGYFFCSGRLSTNRIDLKTAKCIFFLKSEILAFRTDYKMNLSKNRADYSKEVFQSEVAMLSKSAIEKNINNGSTEKLKAEKSDKENVADDGNTVETTQTLDDNKEKVGEVQAGVKTEVLASNVPDRYTYELFGVKVRSECKYNLENEIKDLNVDFNKKDLIIFHTHTCESYTKTEQFSYNESGNYRTTDLNYSVCRVGDELEKYLKEYGYNVIHNKNYHDYPSYNGSYNRSLATVKDLLDTYKNIDMVIDLHRDAIGDNTYAPTVKIGDDYCARVMFVVGTDGAGLWDDNWRENVKIAIKIQQKANELYPGLFKPVIVRNSRYNHHLAKGACIIEVGATRKHT